LILYVIDDLIETHEAAKLDPDAQYVGKWADAEEVDRVNGDTEKCPKCGGHISGFEWLYPRKIKFSNKRYPDRISWWLQQYFIVSERFVEAYNKTDLLGIEKFNSIEVVLKKSTNFKAPEYFCADIIRSDVRVDYKKSKIYGQKYDWKCELCNPRGRTLDSLKLLVMDSTRWAGEDIFRTYGMGEFFATQKFVDFCCKNHFTNFIFTPVNKYKIW
jgi:hypothetical protein